jgi:hypothetical protein
MSIGFDQRLVDRHLETGLPTNFFAIGDRTPPSMECSLGGVRFHGRALIFPSEPSLLEHQHEVLFMCAK